MLSLFSSKTYIYIVAILVRALTFIYLVVSIIANSYISYIY